MSDEALTLPITAISASNAFDADVSITGQISQKEVADVSFKDTLIKIATGNTGVDKDIGIIADYNTDKKVGMFFDSTDEKWKVVSDVKQDDSFVVDTDTITYAPFNCGSLTIEGNLTCSGQIGNISTEFDNITDDELKQIQNIGATTISSVQWGYLGTTDQPLARSDNAQFQNLTLTGNLTVGGTTTAVNTTTVETKDNTILLNSGEVGAGVTAGQAGIEIDRGTATNYQFVFEEASSSFKVGEITNLQPVATREETPINNTIPRWTTSSNSFVTTGTTTDHLTQGSTNKYYSNTLVNDYLSGGNGISYNAGTISADYNTTNLTITTGKLNTIQDIDATADPTFAGLTINGNISCTGTIGSLSAELDNMTDAEIQQLQNIGTTTISATQWGYLGALNQSLTSTSTVQFQNLTLNGNLTVNGTTTSVNTTTVEAKDNIILLNNGEAGAGVTAGQAGIEIDRGSATNYQFVFEELTDTFKIGEIGSLQPVATREATPSNDTIARWSSASNAFVTASTTTDHLAQGSTNKYYADNLVDTHLSGGNGITYSAGVISADYNSTNMTITTGKLNTIQDINTTATPTFSGLTINGNITVTGTVDGKDVSELTSGGGGTGNLTTEELLQLENINAVTISNTQWGYLGGLDQWVDTSGSPTFGGLNINGNITLTGTVDGVDVAGLKTDVDGFPDSLKTIHTNMLSSLNNNTSLLTQTKWNYLFNLDQELSTTSNATFNIITGGIVQSHRNDSFVSQIISRQSGDNGASAELIAWVGGTSTVKDALLRLRNNDYEWNIGPDHSDQDKLCFWYSTTVSQRYADISYSHFWIDQANSEIVSNLNNVHFKSNADSNYDFYYDRNKTLITGPPYLPTSAPVTLSIGGSTLTAQQIIRGIIVVNASATADTITLPTVALICAEVPKAVIGTSIKFIIDNSASSNTQTIAMGTGGTLRGSSSLVAGSIATITLVITNVNVSYTAYVDIASGGGGVDLTAGELSQLQNIGTTTISATQWGYLGALDQSLVTTATPTLAGLTVNGNITVTGTVDGVDVSGISGGSGLTTATVTTTGGNTAGSNLPIPGAGAPTINILTALSGNYVSIAFDMYVDYTSETLNNPDADIKTADVIAVDYRPATTQYGNLTIRTSAGMSTVPIAVDTDGYITILTNELSTNQVQYYNGQIIYDKSAVGATAVTAFTTATLTSSALDNAMAGTPTITVEQTKYGDMVLLTYKTNNTGDVSVMDPASDMSSAGTIDVDYRPASDRFGTQYFDFIEGVFNRIEKLALLVDSAGNVHVKTSNPPPTFNLDGYTGFLYYRSATGTFENDYSTEEKSVTLVNEAAGAYPIDGTVNGTVYAVKIGDLVLVNLDVQVDQTANLPIPDSNSNVTITTGLSADYIPSGTVYADFFIYSTNGFEFVDNAIIMTLDNTGKITLSTADLPDNKIKYNNGFFIFKSATSYGSTTVTSETVSNAVTNAPDGNTDIIPIGDPLNASIYCHLYESVVNLIITFDNDYRERATSSYIVDGNVVYNPMEISTAIPLAYRPSALVIGSLLVETKFEESVGVYVYETITCIAELEPSGVIFIPDGQIDTDRVKLTQMHFVYRV